MEPRAGLRWASLKLQAPELIDGIQKLIERYRFALIATLRTDGSPRVSAIETHIVSDDLMLVMLPRTHKARDVRRDNRVTLQSPIVDAAAPGAEYKIRGRVLSVGDEGRRAAVADVVENTSGWRPAPTWLFLTVEMSDATYIRWRPDGAAELVRWSVDRPDVQKLRLTLDADFGGYRAG